MKVSQAEFLEAPLCPSSFIFPPSYFPHVPLAVPYWNGATYRAIFRSLVSGQVVKDADLGRLRSAVIEMLGVEAAAPCGSGTLALEIALRACGVRDGDEVVIPTFCCTAIVPPILAVRARPVLADIGDDLNITVETVEAVLTNKTKAIIVPHLFGNPAEIVAIVDLARTRHIQVIDDAAQALGATIDLRPVGSFGDAGVLSFGSEKICAGLGGGIAVSRNKGMFDGGINLDLPPARLAPSLRALSSTLVRRRWRRWTFPIHIMLSRRNADGPDAPPAPYRRESMANLNAAVALSLMGTLPENIAARCARVAVYRELLGSEKRINLVPHRPGSACLTQVVRVLSRRRGEDAAAKLIAALGRAGYEVQGSYVPIHLLGNYQQCVWDRLPCAEAAWAELIELPCEPEVSFDDIERIAAIVKRTVAS